MQEEIGYWVGFSAFPGIGPVRFALLLSYFGSAEAAWNAKQTDLLSIGMNEPLVRQFCRFRTQFSVSDARRKMREKNIQVVTKSDPKYPPLLREIQDAPFVLYVRGKEIAQLKCTKTIGVVGTRKATPYGRRVTAELVRELVRSGVTIVSGMAIGIDTVAHETTLRENGETVAVLGCGVDMIYPRQNAKLYNEIVRNGWVVSEMPPGKFADKRIFPARNRIISGLSRATVVTEGLSGSGALITATNAAEQGRDVFAVPGPITSPFSYATNELLKNGAKLVTNAEDILDELHIDKNKKTEGSPKKERNENVSAEQMCVINVLKNADLHIDDIIRESKLGVQVATSAVTILEIRGIIKKRSNGWYGLESYFEN